MKKIIAMGMALFLTMQTFPVFARNTESRSDDNFNGLREGALSVSSWQITNSLLNNEKISVVNRAGKNMAVLIDKPDSEKNRSIGIKRTDSITSGVFTAELDIRITGGTQYVSLRNDKKSVPEIFLLKLSENVIGYNNIDYPVVMPLNSWNNLRIYVDSENKKLYVYVNRILTDVGFELVNTASDKKVEFSVYTNNSSSAAQMYIDNYKLYNGAPRGAVVIDGVPENELEITQDEITPYKELYIQNFNNETAGKISSLPSWSQPQSYQ